MPAGIFIRTMALLAAAAALIFALVLMCQDERNLASGAQAADSGALPASIYFETGKDTLPADANNAVQAAAAYVKAHPDAKLALSGFTDATGGADLNADLAKRRAQAVRDALKAAGVPEDHIVLKKPESVTGGTDAKEARRVEISPAA